MAVESSLQERFADLERAIEADGGPGRRRGHLVRQALLLLLIALVTVNVWLTVRQTTDASRREQERAFWVLCHGGSTAEQRKAAFLTLVAAGNTEWQAARLNGIDLREADFAGVELERADLRGSQLPKAYLRGAKLNRTIFTLADLSDADLRLAELSEADFLRADLRRANLNEAQLAGASLEQVDGRGATLVMADLTDADLLMVDLTGADLSGATLVGANLQAAVFVDAKLLLTNLDGVDLRDADFTGSNWWQARGLPPEVLVELQASFAPGEKANPELQESYKTWLAEWMSPDG